MRPGLLLALIVLLALTPTAASGIRAPSAAVHSVSVTFDADTKITQVTETANGTLNFTGQVTVQKLPVERILVSLSARVDTGWAAKVTPDTMVFTSSTPIPFETQVDVPQGTESTVVGKLVVTATARGTGYNFEGTANATITVAQYYRVLLDSDASYFETGKRGVGTTFKLQVANMGNGPDTYALEISNLEKLRSMGWSARLDKEVTPVVQPGLYSEVTVAVTPPKDAPPFEATGVVVEVKATSVGARAHGLTVDIVYPLNFYLRTIDPIFDVTVPIVIVAAVAVSAALVVWRWRQWRKRRAIEVVEDQQ